MVLVVYIQDKLEEKEKEEVEAKQKDEEIKMNVSLKSKSNPMKKLKSLGNNILKKVKVPTSF